MKPKQGNRFRYIPRRVNLILQSLNSCFDWLGPIALSLLASSTTWPPFFSDTD